MPRLQPLIVEIDALAKHAPYLPHGTGTAPLSVASHPVDPSAAPGSAARLARHWSLTAEGVSGETPAPDSVRREILFRSGTGGSCGAANEALDAALAGGGFLDRPPPTSAGRREIWHLPGLAALLCYRRNGTPEHPAAAHAAPHGLRARLAHLAPRDDLQVFVRLPGASAHACLAARACEADSLALWARIARQGDKLAAPIHYRVS